MTTATMTNNITAYGASGTKYNFEVYPIGTQLYVNPGAYLFLRLAANNNWDVLYVGEAEDFSDRLYTNLRQHHRLQCASQRGATHLGLIKVIGGKNSRMTIETDLRNAYNPPCNRQ